MNTGGMSLKGEEDSSEHGSMADLYYSQDSSNYSVSDDGTIVQPQNRKSKCARTNCVRFVFLVPVVAAFIAFVLVYGVSRAIQLSTPK